MHVQVEITQPLQYGDVFFQQIHSADAHEGKRHDVLCLYVGRMSLIFDTQPPPPNRFEWLGFFLLNWRSIIA
jgi:hypothetical protein